MSSQFHGVSWNHPRHGRITENVCQRHEGELLTVLKYLGIGCGESTADPKVAYCDRCFNAGVRPLAWLPQLAAQQQTDSNPLAYMRRTPRKS